MKKIEVKGSLRKEFGKKATKELRKQGMVPCVIYGGEENIHFYTHENELRHIIYTPEVYLIDLNIDGKIVPAIAQDFQFHPVKDNPLHVDFYEVREDKPVKVAMPVKLQGLAEGVKAGGKLFLNRRKLRVKGLVKDIPDFLEVDVTNLGIGKTIKIKELNFDNLQLIGPKDEVVCAVKVTRQARSAAMAAAADGEEGAEATEESAE